MGHPPGPRPAGYEVMPGGREEATVGGTPPWIVPQSPHLENGDSNQGMPSPRSSRAGPGQLAPRLGPASVQTFVGCGAWPLVGDRERNSNPRPFGVLLPTSLLLRAQAATCKKKG